jgi:hypothetical protein
LTEYTVEARLLERHNSTTNLLARLAFATTTLTMQRIDPRPEPGPPQSTTPPQQSQNNQAQGQGQASQFMPTGFASTGANPHTQSFEEIYGIPENFLEIEVRWRDSIWV